MPEYTCPICYHIFSPAVFAKCEGYIPCPGCGGIFHRCKNGSYQQGTSGNNYRSYCTRTCNKKHICNIL